MTSPKRWHFSKSVLHLQPAFFSASPFRLYLVDDNAVVASQSLIVCMHCPAFVFSLAGQSLIFLHSRSKLLTCSPPLHRLTEDAYMPLLFPFLLHSGEECGRHNQYRLQILGMRSTALSQHIWHHFYKINEKKIFVNSCSFLSLAVSVY